MLYDPVWWKREGRVAGAVVLKREAGTVRQGRDGLSWKHRWLTCGDRKEVAHLCRQLEGCVEGFIDGLFYGFSVLMEWS